MAFVDGPGEPTEKARQMTEALQRAIKATTLLPVESREAMKSRAEMLLDIEGFETLSSATAIEELSEAISQQVEQLKQLKLSVKNLSMELTKERRKQYKTAKDAQNELARKQKGYDKAAATAKSDEKKTSIGGPKVIYNKSYKPHEHP
ncbi:hypothetical protein N9L68_07870 [bacterium]|nr:hypothetical protein [bacterium]